MTTEEIAAALAAPFPPASVKWRPGATNNDKTQALAFAYIDSRAIQDRLDSVVGIAGWQDSYRAGASGGVTCRVELWLDGQWIGKEDAAENTDVEAVKGGVSDALRRAAVKWGVGRYLYNLPTTWHKCEAYGKSIRLVGTPTLPSWATPGSAPRQQNAPAQQSQAAPENPRPRPAQRSEPELAGEANGIAFNEFMGQCKGFGLGQRIVCEGLGFEPSNADQAKHFLETEGPAALKAWEEANPGMYWNNLVSRLVEKRDAAVAKTMAGVQ